MGGPPFPIDPEEDGGPVAKTEIQDEVLFLRAAGVDVGKRFVIACVRTPNPRGRNVELGD